MERVAHFLQKHAIQHTSNSREFDLFGRSSFNRYYYASYLQVRKLLGSLHGDWAVAQHASIPDLLTGQVLTRLKRQQAKAQKVNDSEAVRHCEMGKRSASALSSLMKKAYSVRIVADYEPDITITDDGYGRFKLNAVSITDAHDWPELVAEHCRRIERAWRLGNE